MTSPEAGMKEQLDESIEDDDTEDHDTEDHDTEDDDTEDHEHWARFRRKLKTGLIIAGIIIFVMITVLFSGFRYVEHELSPVKSTNRAVRVVIPAGMGTAGISDILQQEGIIRNSTLFTYYLLYNGQGQLFKAGTYDMLPGMSKQQIIDKLNDGDVVKVQMVRYSFPEGLNIQQMAAIIGNQHAMTASVFVSYADAKHNYNHTWASEIPNDPNLKHRLEGYLFPETYSMVKDSTPADIIQRLLDELNLKLQQLPPDWQAQMAKDGVNFHQMLTVASLIEREVTVSAERPIVAGVIYNRLKLGMPLQMDATIQYLLAQPKDALNDKDLQIESPYNTYLHKGLPPGPIANPSLESIRAAIYPQPSKYLYYVAKNDGSHRHLFAVTFAEHQHNIVLSNAAGKK